MITISPAGSGTTQLFALIPTQINLSSVGDTYTDTPGNTYAETASQTRLTMSAARIRCINMQLAGHVNAGTGSFILRNVTDASDISTAATTTSTTEAALTAKQQVNASHQGDLITIRVKNSGAGNTVTIDRGGMIDCDDQTAARFTAAGTSSVFSGAGGGFNHFPKTISLGVVVVTTGSTFSAQPFISAGTLSDTTSHRYSVGSPLTEANAGVNTLTPLIKFRDATTSAFRLNVTAASGNIYIGGSLDCYEDNI